MSPVVNGLYTMTETHIVQIPKGVTAREIFERVGLAVPSRIVKEIQTTPVNHSFTYEPGPHCRFIFRVTKELSYAHAMKMYKEGQIASFALDHRNQEGLKKGHVRFIVVDRLDASEWDLVARWNSQTGTILPPI